MPVCMPGCSEWTCLAGQDTCLPRWCGNRETSVRPLQRHLLPGGKEKERPGSSRWSSPWSISQGTPRPIIVTATRAVHPRANDEQRLSKQGARVNSNPPPSARVYIQGYFRSESGGGNTSNSDSLQSPRDREYIPLLWCACISGSHHGPHAASLLDAAVRRRRSYCLRCGRGRKDGVGRRWP